MIEAHRNFDDHYNFTIYLFGNQTHAGDFHYTGFTEQTLRTYMLSAEFQIDIFIERDNWLYLVEGTRVQDWTELLDTHRDATNAKLLLSAYDVALGRVPKEPFLSSHLREMAGDQPTRRDARRRR